MHLHLQGHKMPLPNCFAVSIKSISSYRKWHLLYNWSEILTMNRKQCFKEPGKKMNTGSEKTMMFNLNALLYAAFFPIKHCTDHICLLNLIDGAIMYFYWTPGLHCGKKLNTIIPYAKASWSITTVLITKYCANDEHCILSLLYGSFSQDTEYEHSRVLCISLCLLSYCSIY